MKKVDPSAFLENRILELEMEVKADTIELKSHFKEAVHSLRPGALLKRTVKDVITSPDIQNNIVNSLVGLATGFVARKLLVRGSKNPIKKVMGKIAEVSIANKIGNSGTGSIKNLGGILLKKLFHKNG